ncbi:MAG: DEAD/DEAH box helicase [Chitinophagales bacterium]|nr:DEAD/DEAH box helicase [Chitinophagales bacterium]
MAKRVIKIAFCIQPKNIEGFYNLFSMLLVEKKENQPLKFTPLEFFLDNLDYNKKLVDVEVRSVFEDFTPEHIKFRISEQTKFFRRQKSGGNLEKYIQKAITRELYENFQMLVKCQDKVSLYHKITNPKTGNLLNAPCKISDKKTTLSFELIKENEVYSFITWIEIDATKFNINEFKQNSFLIEKDNIYYLLSLEDNQYIQFVYNAFKEKHLTDETLIMKEIIKKIEHKYTVETNNIYQSNTIDVEPMLTIYLSEINSGSFLMITPQFKYDDIVVEGNFQAKYTTTIDGKVYTILRDDAKENELLNFIQQAHPNFEKQKNAYYYLSFTDAKKKNWFYKFYHQLLEKNIELVGMDMLKHFRYSSYPLATEIKNIKTIDSFVEADLYLSFGKEKVDLKELQKNLYNNQKSVLLKDNSIGILDDDWLTKYGVLIKHATINKNTIKVAKWILLQAESLSQSTDFKFIIDKQWWNKWNDWQNIDNKLYEIPTTIKATLRDYQYKGFEWFSLLSEIGAGACLADDMGLGKTLQTICFIAHQLEQDAKANMLIVCPNSLIYNWETELQKFLPSAKSFIYKGSQRNLSNFFANNNQVLITSYATMRNDIDLIKSVYWNTVVLDECHHIKNLYTQTTKASYQILAKNRIGLSGTPIINNSFDLYAQLNFLLPSYLGTQEFFKKEFATPIDRHRSEEKMLSLQKLTAPFILRRTKQQVAKDLPEKTELTLWCEMGDEQKAVYDQIKNQIKQSIFLNIKENGIGKSKLSILQGILKLRQVCSATQLVKDLDVPVKQSVKVDMLIDEITNNLSSNKILIFSQFKGMLHLIGEQLSKNNLSYYHFDGDVDIKDRQEMINAFQTEGNTTNIFLMTIQSGNAGINLTAADYVFIVDPWWNTAIQQQAIDRTHRIGQTKNVFAYKMICKDTIEEKILAIQSQKQIMSDNLITAEENFVKNLTQEDLQYLFT